MRLGLRGLVVSLLSPFVAMACLGDNQCLNPQPECPGYDPRPGLPGIGGTFGSAAGSGNLNEGPPYGGSPATGAGGRGIHIDPGAAGESSGEAAGAGGDTAVIPGADGGAAGSSGAAGSDGLP